MTGRHLIDQGVAMLLEHAGQLRDEKWANLVTSRSPLLPFLPYLASPIQPLLEVGAEGVEACVAQIHGIVGPRGRSGPGGGGGGGGGGGRRRVQRAREEKLGIEVELRFLNSQLLFCFLCCGFAFLLFLANFPSGRCHSVLTKRGQKNKKQQVDAKAYIFLLSHGTTIKIKSRVVELSKLSIAATFVISA